MWRQFEREIGSVFVGLALVLVVLAQMVMLWVEGGSASILYKVSMMFLSVFAVPSILFPLMLGLGLVAFGLVSRSRRLRIGRVASGAEDVDEPTPEHQRDLGFIQSHMLGLIRCGFLSVVLGLMGGVMIAISSGQKAEFIGGVVGVVAAAFIALTPLKWWREWRMMEAVSSQREEWQVEEGSAPAGVRFDFGGASDEGSDAERSEREQADEVTQAR